MRVLNESARCGARRVCGRSYSLALLALLASLSLSSCVSYIIQPGTPTLAEVVKSADEVLRDRYYQVRVYAPSGHVVAYTPIVREGLQRVRKKVDVVIRYETTGHFMPQVNVRTYYDLAEPPFENGDFSSPFETRHPYPAENWTAIHYDRQAEDEIRQAILDKMRT